MHPALRTSHPQHASDNKYDGPAFSLMQEQMPSQFVKNRLYLAQMFRESYDAAISI
ncbi:hypothetical protein ApDm4_2289 [Acetobacter pomorum]|nr:hypothetical protein ApDm4_2289 [Acetobacter pomorum]